MSGGLQLTKLKMLWQSEHYLLIRAFTVITQNQHRGVCSYSGLLLLFAHAVFPLSVSPWHSPHLSVNSSFLFMSGYNGGKWKYGQKTTNYKKQQAKTHLSVLIHFTTMDNVAHSHLLSKFTKWIYMKLGWRTSGRPENSPLIGLDPDKGKNLGFLSHFFNIDRYGVSVFWIISQIIALILF